MSEKTMPVTGGCLCGAVRYEASEPPRDVVYCHCRICQKSQGNVFSLGAEFRGDTLALTRGELKFYKSSDIAERGFCADCGTPILFRYLESELIFVWVGTFDKPDNAPPTRHFGIESQVSWLTIDDRLPRTRTEDDPDFTAAKATAGQGEE